MSVHWIDPGNLKRRYRLFNPDETWAEVVSVVDRPAALDAWNLTVEASNSYFVAETEGASPVWVHNACKVLPRNWSAADIADPDFLNGCEACARQIRKHLGGGEIHTIKPTDPAQLDGLITQSGSTGMLRLRTAPEELPTANLLPGPRESGQVTRVAISIREVRP